MPDVEYFNSYSGSEVHRLMLSDHARTDAYRRAIEAMVQPGMVVLDVGTGTGILSLFAARAGAERVFAVDNSGIIRVAERIAAANNLSDRIEFRRGLVEEVELPGQVDMIISEWMGFFALAEHMFLSVLHARDRFLARGGWMMPSRIKLCIVPVQDPKLHKEEGLGMWEQPVYGFDYAPMTDYELGDLSTTSQVAKDTHPLAKPAVVADIDCRTARSGDFFFDSANTFEILEDGVVHGFVGHFEAELAPGVVLSTAADQPLTHWRQSWFPVRARQVRAGDQLRIAMRATEDDRSQERLPLYFMEGDHLPAGGGEVDRFFYCHHGTFD